ncbi:arsenosugar biosynthesis radical SAM (seleno)protein ArsS [Gallicola sp. Sow4_E12]|uniref:arsenosugar biosynthesis radical SAM (seleno)protein ArsS n=1 Tax=Gallicola sp. Sow4_E12 TaxID=3438785 RepID=UPI003F93A7E4
MNFKDKVDNQIKDIHILQLNIGKGCNLKCSHCHVEASPKRSEMMSREIFDKAMKIYDKFSLDTIDITGGEPTLHPEIDYFIEESAKRSKNVILRTNLADLNKKTSLIKQLSEHKSNIVASLPCYTKENVDKMRGHGTFEKALKSIKVLNDYGYGKELSLDLVYNPLGAFLPPSQKSLEEDYKRELSNYGIEFTNLLTITNIPMGYFKEELTKEGRYNEYMGLLKEHFNEDTVDNIMCRYQISVSFDGKIYDCDFNQMENLEIKEYPTVDKILEKDSLSRNIIFENYCYGCTTGAGSSCGGALNE